MKRKGALWAVAVTFGVILLLYLMQQTGWERTDMAGPGKALRELAWPFQKAADAVRGGVGDFLGYFRSNRLLRQENQTLEESLAAAEYWLQQMEELQEENRRLGELLDYRTEHSRAFDLVVAQVIGKDADNWNQTVILDKGRAQGIDSDMAVIVPAGMVGRVVAVTEHTAEVLLLIDRESAIGAMITETRFSPGIVAGTGRDDLLEMLRVDRDMEILPGQAVITSGYGSVFPKGLMIGAIEQVQPEPGGLTQKAEIRPAVDFRRLEEVMIIRRVLAADEALTAPSPFDLPAGGGESDPGEGR